MAIEFNFSRLAVIYRDAISKKEPTIVFEIEDGVGRFVFMMFFADDDESRDQLFILLRRTGVLLSLKMYGNHMNGNFQIYLNEENYRAIREELNIQGGQNPFDIHRFLNNLNGGIPQELPLSRSVEALRANREAIEGRPELRNIVAEAAKIYPIGPMALPEGRKPDERKLRKLYLHIQASPEVIANFVAILKRTNRTFAWTDDPKKANENILRVINRQR